MPIDPDKGVQLIVLLEREQKKELDSLIPHGMRSDFFRVIIDRMIEILKTKDGSLFLALLMQNKVYFHVKGDSSENRKPNVVPPASS